MSKFMDSFAKGLQAAENAERARNEINQVFTALNDDLSKATNGMLNIDRQEMAGLMFAAMMFTQDGRVERTQKLGLYAWNPKASDTGKKFLAKWELSPNGYPCTISWGGNDYACYDRESLEARLASLLEDGGIAEKLKEIIASNAKSDNG